MSARASFPMNLPKLSTLVIVLLLATGWTLAWYVEGSDEVRAERMAVELETAHFVALVSDSKTFIQPRRIVVQPDEVRETEPSPQLGECPFVPGSDRV